MTGFDLQFGGDQGPGYGAGLGAGGLGAYRDPLLRGIGADSIEGIGETDEPRELGGFAKALADSVGEVQGLQEDLAGKYEQLAQGEPVPLHDIYIAAGKADVAFNLMLEVRNRLVDAWQQLQRTPV